MHMFLFLCLSLFAVMIQPSSFAQATPLSFGITPLKKPTNLNDKKVKLGKELFHDVRLSKDNSISCAHCHGLDTGGVDNLKHSFGVGGAEGGINTPTVYNSGLNLAQFWDGRAASLEEQVDGPTHNPIEMASNWNEIIGKLRMDKLYVKKFKLLYGAKGLSPANVRHAIAEFERSLVTVNSPFDRYLQGDQQAITSAAKKGFGLFRNYGCISCHQGANVGGNMFQTLGVFGNYFEDRGNLTEADEGRFAVTKRASDKHKFKVPSLRVVTLTAPYFHDGTAKTLTQAIMLMGKHQLGRQIPEQDVALIIEFLKSLVGELEPVGELH